MLTVMLTAGGAVNIHQHHHRMYCLQMMSTHPPLGVLPSVNIVNMGSISVIAWRLQTPPAVNISSQHQ